MLQQEHGFFYELSPEAILSYKRSIPTSFPAIKRKSVKKQKPQSARRRDFFLNLITMRLRKSQMRKYADLIFN
ncbi:hypothetical protein SAMN05192574_107138 [Mucilaginibacter gossypiicola]|uniref:Uncharacterized protein n=1 Tax=Mucilaginibacter gossypiicola TaxID=551995 RepID=A0A1H8NXE3_9SPHI|nr:hypothetical protein SAMN05192574_107138 [Mucilaginibacter gossypiicola]